MRGGCVAALGGARLARGEMDRVASLEPLYVRSPEATFKLECAQAGGHRHGGLWSNERKSSFSSMLTHDEELKTLYAEHQELKRQLEVFRNKHYLTTEEEIEEKRIQKLKLASKDRMMAILDRHQHEAR